MTDEVSPGAVVEALQADLPEGGNPPVAWLDKHVEQIRLVTERLTTWAVLCKLLGSKPGNLYPWAVSRGLREKGPPRPYQKRKKAPLATSAGVAAGRRKRPDLVLEDDLPAAPTRTRRLVVEKPMGLARMDLNQVEDLVRELSGLPGVRVMVAVNVEVSLKAFGSGVWKC